MRYLARTAFVLLCALPFAALGEETDDGLLPAGEIRRLFDGAASEWTAPPRLVRLAFVAAEDDRHFEKLPQHSKITLNLVKSVLARRAERSSLRHIRLYGLSLRTARALTQDEILDWYINVAYLGRGCVGLASAARAYFGREMQDLSLQEAAYLAGLGHAPSIYHPLRSPDRAMERRNAVLEKMREANFIGSEEADAALRTELVVRDPLGSCGPG